MAVGLTVAADHGPFGEILAQMTVGVPGHHNALNATAAFATAAEFGSALGLADEAIVLDVYAAREDPEPGVTGQLIVDAVPGGHARFVPDPARVAAVIDAIAEPGDVVLTMGAGDITALGPRLVEILTKSVGSGGDDPPVPPREPS